MHQLSTMHSRLQKTQGDSPGTAAPESPLLKSQCIVLHSPQFTPVKPRISPFTSVGSTSKATQRMEST